MKSIKTNLLTLVFSLLSILAYGQAVDAVVLVNGVANNVTKTKTMCLLQDSVKLEASNCGTCTAGTNVTIKWTQTFSPFTVFNSNVVYAKKGGWWRVTVTNNSNPTEVDKDSVFINFYPYPNFNIVMPAFTQMCYLDTYPPYNVNYDTASTTYTGALPISNYQWYFLRFSDNQLIKLIGSTHDTLVYNKVYGYYVVSATDGNGCVIGDTSLSYVDRNSTLATNLGPDPTSSFCEGTNYPIQSNAVVSVASATYYYRRGSTILSSGTVSNSTPPIYSMPLTSPGIQAYNVFIVDNSYTLCPGLDTITLSINPLPAFSFPPSLVLCYGTTLPLTPTITNGTPISSWTWNGTPAALSYLSATNIPNPTISNIPGNTAYSVVANNACGNRTIPVTVNYNPAIVIKASATGYASSSQSDTIICALSPLGTAGTAKLSSNATGGSSGFTYNWAPAYGFNLPAIPTSKNTDANPLVDTSYTVTATDAGGCTATKTVKVKLQKPTLSITTTSAAVPPIVNEDAAITVTAASNATKFSWKAWKQTVSGTDSLFNSSVNPTKLPLLITSVSADSSSFITSYLDIDKTVYYYVTVTDSKGCINRDSLSMGYISKNVVLYVPNVFSPYAEKDENKKLKVFGPNLSSEDFKMIVYNKWGKQVWEGDLNAAIDGWDGSSYEQGVYTYYISGKFKNDLPVTTSPYYKGNFTLLK